MMGPAGVGSDGRFRGGDPDGGRAGGPNKGAADAPGSGGNVCADVDADAGGSVDGEEPGSELSFDAPARLPRLVRRVPSGRLDDEAVLRMRLAGAATPNSEGTKPGSCARFRYTSVYETPGTSSSTLQVSLTIDEGFQCMSTLAPLWLYVLM